MHFHNVNVFLAMFMNVQGGCYRSDANDFFFFAYPCFIERAWERKKPSDYHLTRYWRYGDTEIWDTLRYRDTEIRIKIH